MIEKFRKKADKCGQSMTWFHKKYFKQRKRFTYGAMMHQLNGHTGMSVHLKKAVRKYMEEG